MSNHEETGSNFNKTLIFYFFKEKKIDDIKDILNKNSNKLIVERRCKQWDYLHSCTTVHIYNFLLPPGGFLRYYIFKNIYYLFNTFC